MLKTREDVMLDQRMLSHVHQLLAGKLNGKKVTLHNPEYSVKAVDAAIKDLMAIRTEISGARSASERRGFLAPRNDGATGHKTTTDEASNAAPAPHHLNEREAGQRSIAEPAMHSAPAPSHLNSEGGASAHSPVTAIDATPLPSLLHDDGEGHSALADEAIWRTPSPSSPTHSAAGQPGRADTAKLQSPVRAVVPTDAQKAMNRRIAGELVESIMNRQVRYGGSAKVWGDLHQTDLDAVVIGNAKDAARSAFDATFADALRQRWGRDYVSRRVRDRFSAKELQEIEDEVRRCGAKVARTVARETRGVLPAA
jgi:hypothetical protein